MTQPSIYFKQLELGPMQNFIYLVGDPTTREAAVVDPGWEVPRILRCAEDDGYRITKAFVTHHHFDHVMGLGELLRAVDVPVYVHRRDAPLVKVEPGSLKPLSGGETIDVGGVTIQLLHTPGHTPGSVCLLVNGRLLSGDTLFINGCGRCDLPGGDPRVMFESLSKTLKVLDDATTLCPGHNYAETPTARLGDEKHANPFLAAPTLHDFLRLTGFA
ncbi:MAG: MBL fold metallo-hydrolase [Candidatus Omnitrophica bacterium]|nr:MBL fold metallo-hydrolase [Candidatus Omnitrophota bacterium]